MSQNEEKNGNEETVFPESHGEMLNRYIAAIRAGDKAGPDNDLKPKGITK